MRVQGIGNELTDAGSRGKWDVLHTVAAAIGLRLHRVYIGKLPWSL